MLRASWAQCVALAPQNWLLTCERLVGSWPHLNSTLRMSTRCISKHRSRLLHIQRHWNAINKSSASVVRSKGVPSCVWGSRAVSHLLSVGEVGPFVHRQRKGHESDVLGTNLEVTDEERASFPSFQARERPKSVSEIARRGAGPGCLVGPRPTWQQLTCLRRAPTASAAFRPGFYFHF